MRRFLTTAAMAVFLCAPAMAADTCQQVADMVTKAKAHGLPIKVITQAENPSAMSRALMIYNALPGNHVDAVDALDFVLLPDGGMFIAFEDKGEACAGLTAEADKAAHLTQAILGEDS